MRRNPPRRVDAETDKPAGAGIFTKRRAIDRSQDRRYSRGQSKEAFKFSIRALDCSDNFATRHAINRTCVAHRKLLVSGAGMRFDGQVAVFDLRVPQARCYHCLFPEQGDNEDMRCAVMGVFAPLTGIIGATQAAEVLKLIAGIGDSLNGRLLLLDALAMEWRTARLTHDPVCAVCGPRAGS